MDRACGKLPQHPSRSEEYDRENCREQQRTRRCRGHEPSGIVRWCVRRPSRVTVAWDQNMSISLPPNNSQTLPKTSRNRHTHQDILFPPTCTHGLWGLLMDHYGVTCTRHAPMDSLCWYVVTMGATFGNLLEIIWKDSYRPVPVPTYHAHPPPFVDSALVFSICSLSASATVTLFSMFLGTDQQFVYLRTRPLNSFHTTDATPTHPEFADTDLVLCSSCVVTYYSMCIMLCACPQFPDAVCCVWMWDWH